MYYVYLYKQRFDTGHIGFKNGYHQTLGVDAVTVATFFTSIYEQCITLQYHHCDNLLFKSTQFSPIALPSTIRSVYSVSDLSHSLYLFPSFFLSFLFASLPSFLLSSTKQIFSYTKFSQARMLRQLRKIRDAAKYPRREWIRLFFQSSCRITEVGNAALSKNMCQTVLHIANYLQPILSIILTAQTFSSFATFPFMNSSKYFATRTHSRLLIMFLSLWETWTKRFLLMIYTGNEFKTPSDMSDSPRSVPKWKIWWVDEWLLPSEPAHFGWRPHRWRRCLYQRNPALRL